jgi:hypothetical protein
MVDKKKKPIASVKRFVVTLEVEGSHVDADTPVSAQALIDLLEMQFSNPHGVRLIRVDAEEKTKANS